MFQSSRERFRAWLIRFDDILADDPGETATDAERFAHHPHRRPLRWERDRRPGSVPTPPAHCISPVRAARDAHDRSAVTR